MKFSRIAAVAAIGTVAITAAAHATPISFNFSEAVAFSFVSAYTSDHTNAAANLANAAEFTFGNQPPNGNFSATDINANTTANPVTNDPNLVSQMSYQKFLSSSSVGTALGGTGGTKTLDNGVNFYFINFVNANNPNAGAATIGGFETSGSGFGVTSYNSTDPNHLNITLTGLFTPNAPNDKSTYLNTPATLTIGFTSSCSAQDPGNASLCSVSASGTLAAGQFVSPVPEPATLALLGTGVLGLGLVLRRKAS